MTDPRIEAAARALCEINGNDPDGNDSYVQSGMGANWHAYEDDAHAALASADAAAWKPIETAPKDDIKILGFDGYFQELVVWLDGGWWSDAGFTFLPTHWQPLPNPPRHD